MPITTDVQPGCIIFNMPTVWAIEDFDVLFYGPNGLIQKLKAQNPEHSSLILVLESTTVPNGNFIHAGTRLVRELSAIPTFNKVLITGKVGPMAAALINIVKKINRGFADKFQIVATLEEAVAIAQQAFS